MSGWPPDKGKAKVRIRSGSRSTSRSGWSTRWLGSGNIRLGKVSDKGKQCQLTSG
jgi:hypothetical protein